MWIVKNKGKQTREREGRGRRKVASPKKRRIQEGALGSGSPKKTKKRKKSARVSNSILVRTRRGEREGVGFIF